MRSFTSRNRWFTLFTLTRTVHPWNSPRTIAYPVIDRHSAGLTVLTPASLELFALIRFLWASLGLDSAHPLGLKLRHRRMAGRATARSFRPRPATRRACRFPGCVHPPIQEFY